MSQHEGLEPEALEPWLREHVDVRGDITARLIAGGKSNLTYRLGDDDRTWILRRPPLGHVLASAHDMSREYRVMDALSATAVPVPRMIAACEDETVLGAPFYLMEDVHGTPYRRAADLDALGVDRTRAIAAQLIDVLIELHSIDPAEVGLSDFGRPEGYLERQVAVWKRQLEASATRDIPAADELHRRLRHEVEAVSRRSAGSGIVHGDFRLDNTLINDADRILAVVDWEMATLGDPLADLGLMLTYQKAATWPGLEDLVTDASNAAGWPTPEETIAAYDAGSRRDLSDIGFHVALASFKLATIAEGIHRRYLQGKTLGGGFEQIGTIVDPLMDYGLSALEPA